MSNIEMYWRDAKLTPPLKEGAYLAWFKYGDTGEIDGYVNYDARQGKWTHQDDNSDAAPYVTHWMPRPRKPRGIVSPDSLKVPEGYALVPIDPSLGMMDRAFEICVGGQPNDYLFKTALSKWRELLQGAKQMTDHAGIKI